VIKEEELAKITENFSLDYRIAQGGQADVFKAEYNGQAVAIKKFSASNPNSVHSFLGELEVLKRYFQTNLSEALCSLQPRKFYFHKLKILFLLFFLDISTLIYSKSLATPHPTKARPA